MSRQEREEFNVVGLVRSPVKRTPRGYAPASAGGSLSGATTARMSTERSVRSVSSTSSAAGEARRRQKVLRPLAGNSMFDNSVYSSSSSRSTADTPCSSSPLDMMSLTISSNKKAVAARRSNLPVSRMLKLSPAVDTNRQHQESMAEARTAESGRLPYSETTDHTQHSITQSALFSILDRSPPTPHNAASPSNPTKSSNPNQDPLSTPRAALGDTDFLGGGDISNIDEGRSGVWSECSFTGAVFSPDPATPREARGGSSGRGARAISEQAPGTEVSPTIREEGHSESAAEIGMRAGCSSMGTTGGHPSLTTASACTPAAVSALLHMGGHSVGTVPTPDSVTSEASRYRGYVPCSPIATSGVTRKECDEGEGGGEVPNIPAAAATLAAMMMDTSDSALRSGTAATKGREEEGEEDEEARSFAEEDARDEDENSAPTGVQVLQPKQPTPETPSRHDNMSARLPIITPRRRKAASQLLDLSKATPKTMIRGILEGRNGRPGHAGKHRQQHARFVPQVASLEENLEEETPRALLKGICAQENPLGFAPSRTRCNSTSVAEAAAAAAAAAAASTAAAAESAKAVGERAEGRRAGDASRTLPHPTAQPPSAAGNPAATAVVVHSSLSAKGAGKTFLKVFLVLILMVVLLRGALVLTKDVVVEVLLALAGPAPTRPIY